MKKKVIYMLLAMSLSTILTACGHEHTWVEATCTQPKHCSECEETEGEELEHLMTEATYKKPSTCSLCGKIEGDVLPDYFTKNNLQISPVGSFTFSSMVNSKIVDLKGNLTIREEISGDKKMIVASFEVPRYVFEDGSSGWSLNLGYIDKYTGTAIMSGGSGDKIKTTITIDDVDYDIVFSEEFINGDSVVPTYFNLKVTCPIDYDGTAFYICGTDASLDGDIVYDTYISANDIAHGEYDILYFLPMESSGKLSQEN